jgi:DNA-binding NarL/FixJ family response regulator
MGRDHDVAVVADESALCGAGLLHIVEHCLDFSTVLSCRNFTELAGILGQYRSRVGLAVVQFDLPGMTRANGLHRLCAAWPSLPVLVTGDGCGRDMILEALSAGSRGFIPKSSSPQELEQAMKAAAAGQTFVSPLSVGSSAFEAVQVRKLHEADLTARQREVLNLLAAGNSNKQIARALGISEGTVKVHVNAAFRALGVHNRVNATTALLGLSDFTNTGS